MPCGGPPGGHKWRFGRIFPERPRSAHGINMHMFVMFTFQDVLLNIGRVCTLNTIFIVFCPQTDFEKDVDMACRSGNLLG